MTTFRSEIIINAPAAKVWELLTNFSSYAAWNPFLVTIKGDAVVGAPLTITAKLSRLPSLTFDATIRMCESPTKLGWDAIFLKGVFEAFHHFAIDDEGKAGECQCRFIHTEEFSGIFSNVVLFVLESKFKQGYGAMNEALKKVAEE